jgi:hypothetical protein
MVGGPLLAASCLTVSVRSSLGLYSCDVGQNGVTEIGHFYSSRYFSSSTGGRSLAAAIRKVPGHGARNKEVGLKANCN